MISNNGNYNQSEVLKKLEELSEQMSLIDTKIDAVAALIKNNQKEDPDPSNPSEGSGDEPTKPRESEFYIVYRKNDTIMDGTKFTYNFTAGIHMTFGDWVDSQYNTGIEVSGNKGFFKNLFGSIVCDIATTNRYMLYTNEYKLVTENEVSATDEIYEKTTYYLWFYDTIVK